MNKHRQKIKKEYITIPECWKVIEYIDDEGKTNRRVFAGWRGGYLSGDSWRLNSSIVKTEEFDKYYIFHGTSGSKYCCHKKSEGIMSMWLQSIFEDFVIKLNAKVINTNEQ
jgi:hypothetical protein